MEKLFLSYSKKDNEFVLQLKRDLNKAGLSIWMDKTGLKRGSPAWKREIENAIKASSGFLVVLSPSAKESDWVGMEIGYAKLFGIPVFSVLARGTQQDSVPIDLVNSDWFDARQRYSMVVLELVGAIKGQNVGKINLPTDSSAEERDAKTREIFSFLESTDFLINDWKEVTIGKVRVTKGEPQSYDPKKPRFYKYRATIHPLDDADILESSRKLELRGWKIGLLASDLDLQLRLLLNFPDTKALVRTWGMSPSKFSSTPKSLLEEMAKEIIAANEILGMWAEDIRIEQLRGRKP